jgi:hypothetical protein
MDNTKTKKQCDEATLKRLAAMRLKANEVRKKKAELRKAQQEEQKRQFEKEYETKVLKKPEPKAKAPIKEAEIEHDIYPEQPASQEVADSDDEGPTEPAPSKKPSKSKAPPRPKAQPVLTPQPNYKQEYYKMKLYNMQQHQHHLSVASQYAQQPPQVHAQDIARQSLQKTMDKAMYERVYKDLFGL